MAFADIFYRPMKLAFDAPLNFKIYFRVVDFRRNDTLPARTITLLILYL